MGSSCSGGTALSAGAASVGLSDAVRALIREAVMSNNIFSDVITQKKLTDNDLLRIVNRFRAEEFDQDQKVFEYGDPAEKCYYLEKGGVDIIGKDGIKFLSLGPNKIFGEIGFLNGAQRAASIVANKKSTLFSLTLKDFELATAEVFSDADLADMTLIRDAFASLKPSPEEMEKVVDLMKKSMYKYRKKEMICSAATQKKFFYIIVRGTVRLSSPNNSLKEVEELGHNDFFGEVAIINETEQICEQCAQASASGDTVVCKIPEEDFGGLLLPVKQLLMRRMVNSRKQHHKRELLRQMSQSEGKDEGGGIDFSGLVTLGLGGFGGSSSSSSGGGGDGGDGGDSGSGSPDGRGNGSGSPGGSPHSPQRRAIVTEELADTKSSKLECSPVACLLYPISPK